MFRSDLTHSSPARAVTVRRATDADAGELARLAALDSARPLSGAALVAEAEARIVAALPLGSGRPIADPFEQTSELLALLELRARQLREDRSRPRRFRERMRDLMRAPLPG